jgi:hypothetical protein
MTYSHDFRSVGLIEGSEEIHDDAHFALHETRAPRPRARD